MEVSMKPENMIGKKLDGYLVEEHTIRIPCPESVVGYDDRSILGIKIQLSPDTYAILSWQVCHDYNKPSQFWMTWNLIGKDKLIIRSFWLHSGTSSKELIWDNCSDVEKASLIIHPLYHNYNDDKLVKIIGRGKYIKIGSFE